MLKRAWFAFVGFVARRTLYMAIAPWVFPVLGGILISTNLDKLPLVNWYMISGAGLIVLGSFPLGIRDYWHETLQKDQDAVEARERRILQLMAEQLPALVISPSMKSSEVDSLVAEQTQLMLDHLVSKVYDNLSDARATFFRPGEQGDVANVFPSAFAGGNGRPPRIHWQGSKRFEGISALMDGPNRIQFDNNLEGRSYRGFASVSVEREGVVAGVLTLDSSEQYLFSAKDGENLLLIAEYFSTLIEARSNLNTQGMGRRSVGLSADSASMDTRRKGTLCSNLWSRLMGK